LFEVSAATRPKKLTSRRLLHHGSRKALRDTPELMQRPMAAEVPPPKDRLDREGDVIKRRVANFKANQKKFQQDREEYYTRTMANARATQWSG
jgi:hypothetical protein